MAPIILRSTNLFNIIATASKDLELLSVYQFGIKQIAYADLVQIVEDPNFTKQEAALQDKILDDIAHL